MARTEIREKVDVCVVGAGHAGCEAALACARLGLETVIFTVSVDSIALMPCNPNIGGSSKGHLVREIDALGGEMGKNIDKTFIQSKMLNVSKGPAVHSLRAQADKADYSRAMRKVLEEQEHLTIKQAEICKLLTEDEIVDKSAKKKITGVQTFTGAIYECKAVILCTGTYLKARCLCGEAITYTGPNGLQAANYLTDSLKELGIEMRRFKTGTPARMDGRSIDYSKMEEQFGDEKVVPFSFSTNPDDVQIDQVSCWLTYTNEETHKIIRGNLDRSPIYAGVIEGTGPRYCPSIEDKVVKFADKERHQVFLEPEGLHTNEMYVGGMSSSLPEDVQLAMYRTVPGLENCKIVRNAYAIEYDCINPRQLYPTLEFKDIEGLFSGGQFNGSSGYEEAAAQGLIAGINAALSIQGKEQIILDRSEAYIGVLIDDLVTKDSFEPYRMMTSRAEYRLLLRQDNADLRLREKGYQAGLVSEELYQATLRKKELIDAEVERLKNTSVGASKNVQEYLTSKGSSTLKTGTNMAELMCRPELSYELLSEIDIDRKPLPLDVIEQVEIEIKYEGYIGRQLKQVNQFKKMEKKKIPEDLDYNDIGSLRLEARQKLIAYQPVSVGQASRISGVSPADISVLLVYLEQYKKKIEDIMKKYNLEQFKKDLNELNISLSEKQVEQFIKYYELLTEWNSFMNLTAITDFDEVLKKHFVDSLSIVKAHDFSADGSDFYVIDIGTGAGFPGIPLKIAFPEIHITLLDSLQKRIKFLDEVILQIGLDKVDTVHGRAEDYAKPDKLREKYDMCVSRAVANLSTLSEYCLPFVKKDGEFISYKSEKLTEELTEAEKAVSILGGKVTGQVDYMLPSSDIYRNLLLIKKVSPTPKKFPRKAGLPAKEPIKTSQYN